MFENHHEPPQTQPIPKIQKKNSKHLILSNKFSGNLLFSSFTWMF